MSQPYNVKCLSVTPCDAGNSYIFSHEGDREPKGVDLCATLAVFIPAHLEPSDGTAYKKGVRYYINLEAQDTYGKEIDRSAYEASTQKAYAAFEKVGNEKREELRHIEQVGKMALESLPPDLYEAWEEIRDTLRGNRNLLHADPKQEKIQFGGIKE